MKVLTDLFVAFFKTGLFTFGGGYAMLPLLKDEVIIKRKFITEDELINYFSIGQCTPGIIAVNVATFCGYKMKKTLGAAVATLALVTPSIIVITLIAAILKNMMNNPSVIHVMNGVKICVVALLIKFIVELLSRILKSSSNKIFDSMVFGLSTLALLCLKASAIEVILCIVLFVGLRIYVKSLKR